jgi:hypothetical protein
MTCDGVGEDTGTGTDLGTSMGIGNDMTIDVVFMVIDITIGGFRTGDGESGLKWTQKLLGQQTPLISQMARDLVRPASRMMTLVLASGLG